MTGLMWECQVTFTSGRRPGVFIFCMCVVGSFLGFFPPPLYFFLFSNFAAAIWFAQSKVASLQCSSSFPHQGPEWQFQQPLGKGLGCFTCDMKADELIKSCLRCGKYWCTCYEASAKLVTEGSEYFEVQESALLLSTKAGWPLFTAVPFWKHRVKYLGVICKMKKKKMESFEFPFKPQRGGKPSCFGLLQKGIGNKPSLKHLGLIPISEDAGPDGQLSCDNSIFYLHENTLLVGGKKCSQFCCE